MDQVLIELDLQSELNQRSFHLQQLRRLTFCAMEDEPRLKRLKGYQMSLTMQHLADANFVNLSKKLPAAAVNEGFAAGVDFLPPKGKRRKARLGLMTAQERREDKEAHDRASLVALVLLT